MIIVLSACSVNKFLNRKYTKGIFLEGHKSLSANTSKTLEDRKYACSKLMFELNNTNISSEIKKEKAFIQTKKDAIEKKGNKIYNVNKPGNSIAAQKGNLTVASTKTKLLVKEKKHASRQKRNSEPDDSNKKIKRDLTIKTFLCLVFTTIPVAGFIISTETKKQIKKHELQNPDINYTPFKFITNITLFFSAILLVITIITALLCISLIILLCFSYSGFFAVALI